MLVGVDKTSRLDFSLSLTLSLSHPTPSLNLYNLTVLINRMLVMVKAYLSLKFARPLLLPLLRHFSYLMLHVLSIAKSLHFVYGFNKYNGIFFQFIPHIFLASITSPRGCCFKGKMTLISTSFLLPQPCTSFDLNTHLIELENSTS